MDVLNVYVPIGNITGCKEKYLKRQELTMNIIEASAILKISTPFIFPELLSAYRREAVIRHPDRGGSNNQFQELTDAFNFMKPLAQINKKEDECNVASKTEDGTLVSELGKGLPLNKNACTCEECNGLGYHARKIASGASIKCPKCIGHGILSYDCKKCSGRGKLEDGKTCILCKGTGLYFPRLSREEIESGFSNTKSGNRVVVTRSKILSSIFGRVCFECDGDGRISYNRSIFSFMDVVGLGRRVKPCGRDYIDVVIKKTGCTFEEAHRILDFVSDSERTFYHKCYKCQGVGEIEMFNPVLPRGLFQSAK